MILTKSLEAFGTDEFDDVLTTELTTEAIDLPLERLSVWGGWIDEPTFEIERVSADPESITIVLRVECTEMVPTGCQTFPEERTGELSIVLDRASGEVEAEVLGAPSPNEDGM